MPRATVIGVFDSKWLVPIGSEIPAALALGVVGRLRGAGRGLRLLGRHQARAADVADHGGVGDRVDLIGPHALGDQLIAQAVRALEGRRALVAVVLRGEALDDVAVLLVVRDPLGERLDAIFAGGDLLFLLQLLRPLRLLVGVGLAPCLGRDGHLGGAPRAAHRRGRWALRQRGRLIHRLGLGVAAVVVGGDLRERGVVDEVDHPCPAPVDALPGRWSDGEQIRRRERLARDGAHRVEIVAERERRARADAQANVAPVFAAGVVDDGPALEADLLVLAQHDPVARLPAGRLGDVGQEELLRVVLRPRLFELDLHRDEAGVGDRRPGGVRDRRGLLRLGVEHGERLQEVVDLVGRDLELELAARHLGGALEVGDAVSVHHDPAQGRAGVDVAGVGRRAAERRERQGRQQEIRASHGVRLSCSGGAARRVADARVSSSDREERTGADPPHRGWGSPSGGCGDGKRDRRPSLTRPRGFSWRPGGRRSPPWPRKNVLAASAGPRRAFLVRGSDAAPLRLRASRAPSPPTPTSGACAPRSRRWRLGPAEGSSRGEGPTRPSSRRSSRAPAREDRRDPRQRARERN